MDGVDHEDGVLRVVDEVQDGLGRVGAPHLCNLKTEEKINVSSRVSPPIVDSA